MIKSVIYQNISSSKSNRRIVHVQDSKDLGVCFFLSASIFVRVLLEKGPHHEPIAPFHVTFL